MLELAASRSLISKGLGYDYGTKTGFGPVRNKVTGEPVECCSNSFGMYDEDDDIKCVYCGRYMQQLVTVSGVRKS